MPRPTHDGCCLRRGASAAATSTSSLSFRHRKISTASTGRLNPFRCSSSSELRSDPGLDHAEGAAGDHDLDDRVIIYRLV